MQYKVIKLTSDIYIDAEKLQELLDKEVTHGWRLNQYVWQSGSAGAGALVIYEKN